MTEFLKVFEKIENKYYEKDLLKEYIYDNIYEENSFINTKIKYENEKGIKQIEFLYDINKNRNLLFLISLNGHYEYLKEVIVNSKFSIDAKFDKGFTALYAGKLIKILKKFIKKKNLNNKYNTSVSKWLH
jgi:hypothetical protein